MKKAKKPAFDIRYISLKEASEISGYHPDYLSYLIRKGKIEGKRIGRDWFTTRESIRDYLLTKKFLSIREVLFPKLSKRTVLILTAAVLIGIAAVLVFTSAPFSQKAPGDFMKKELEVEAVNIQSTNGEVKEVEVTTYFSDEAGGIEISVQPESAFPTPEKEPSLFQKIKDFFSNLVD
ncbi:MAG: hypothetical protein DRH33_01790 [Candidatus Nealsonbacteria bacterium]|nr:MAG: hypothetical protein DRH33_01790 [Candidatus Nealsonbacteria bacterium]